MKFGKREHLEDFRTGTLFMNNQTYFSTLESDLVRGDPFEGTDQIHQPKDILELRITNAGSREQLVFRTHDLAGPVKLNFGKQSYNLFCMYAVTLCEITKPIHVDERNFAFGDSFSVVVNTPKLFGRRSYALGTLGYGSDAKLVQYFDENEYSGDTGPFNKSSKFDYQREFRLAIYPGRVGPLRLSIGDLTDITTPIYPLAKINDLITLETKISE